MLDLPRLRLQWAVAGPRVLHQHDLQPPPGTFPLILSSCCGTCFVYFLCAFFLCSGCTGRPLLSRGDQALDRFEPSGLMKFQERHISREAASDFHFETPVP